MKRGQLVKLVANAPAKHQEPIDDFIGLVTPIVEVDRDYDTGRETGKVSVELPGYGVSVLNPSEFEIMPLTRNTPTQWRAEG